jgi:hypothetical protein
MSEVQVMESERKRGEEVRLAGQARQGPEHTN